MDGCGCQILSGAGVPFIMGDGFLKKTRVGSGYPDTIGDRLGSHGAAVGGILAGRRFHLKSILTRVSVSS